MVENADRRSADLASTEIEPNRRESALVVVETQIAGDVDGMLSVRDEDRDRVAPQIEECNVFADSPKHPRAVGQEEQPPVSELTQPMWCSAAQRHDR
jgi:hypothetical protein